MFLDERGDPRARLPWRTRQAAGKEHVELGLEPADFGLEVNHLLSNSDFGFGHARSAEQVKPEQRQPQLPRVRHGPIVDQHLGAGHRADQLEQIAQPSASLEKNRAR